MVDIAEVYVELAMRMKDSALKTEAVSKEALHEGGRIDVHIVKCYLRIILFIRNQASCDERNLT
jgi:hypothetical protein